MDNVILPDDEVEQNPIVMSLVEYCEYAKYYIITNSKQSVMLLTTRDSDIFRVTTTGHSRSRTRITSPKTSII